MEQLWEVTIDVSNSKELECVPHIRDVLVLCHMINSIRSSQRVFLVSDDRPDSPARKRDTVFFLLSNSSYLYEGMDKAYKLLRRFPDELPKELQHDFLWLRTEAETDGESFFKTILSPIRNELVFHFDSGFSNQPFSSTVGKYPPILGQGTSTRNIDFVYTLPDDLITHYLASLPKHPTPLEEDYHTAEPLEHNLESNCIPDSLRGRATIDPQKAEIIFHGVMQDDERDVLLGVSEDPKFREAIRTLYLNTRVTWIVILLRQYSLRFCKMIDHVIPSLIVEHAELT